MADRVQIARIIKVGNSFCFCLPREVLAELCWNKNDRLALRTKENNLVVERIPLERLALLRKPEEVQRDK